MKKSLFFPAFVVITSFIIFISDINAQVVTGKLIDENNNGLAEVSLELYISPNVYNTTSLSDGSFYFTGVTGVTDEEELPSGYSITNNFPNPFNPTTRLGVTLPGDGNVSVNIYNILGQKVSDGMQEYFTAGTHYLDIELYGLASGIYIAQISIDEKYTVIKKMMLVYGSQHLTSSGGTFNSQLNKHSISKSNLSPNIDSLVATSLIIGRKTFANLPSLSGDTTNLGNLTIDRFCPGMPTVTYEGKTYNTVLIGDQCWLKENLDVGTMISSTSSGFQQTNNGILEKYCYDNNPANCETYGGLYEWPEAMQYSIIQGTQGICPPGWHISTLSEFQTLRTTVNNNGNALKTIGQGSGSGAGTNISEFSALLAGHGGIYGGFYGLGYRTGLWSSTESVAYAGYLILYGIDSSVNLYNGGKEDGRSVRCLKDSEPTTPTLQSPVNGSTNQPRNPTFSWKASGLAISYTLQVSTSSNFTSFVYNQSGLTGTSMPLAGLNSFTQYFWRVNATNIYGTSEWSNVWSFTTGSGGTGGGDPCPGIPTVTYEGKTYSTVQIGEQCWLIENLDIGTMIISTSTGFQQTNNGIIEKYCYGNNPVNCEIYGGLYEWPEAMQYNTTPGAQGICPPGWHIPTAAEFATLRSAVNNDGNALKAIGQGTGGGAGTNTSGFAALLAGYRGYHPQGTFGYLGSFAYFWGSTEYNSSHASYMFLDYHNSSITLSNWYKNYGYSVRCLKD